MRQEKKQPEKVMCKDCAHSYDPHELTAYEPRVPFMCRCPFKAWSQFLDLSSVRAGSTGYMYDAITDSLLPNNGTFAYGNDV